MGLSDEKIKKISEKIEYYVNPFDVAGMLNREHTITKLPGDSDEPLKKPIGKVNVLVPLHLYPRLLIRKAPMTLVFSNRMEREIC